MTPDPSVSSEPQFLHIDEVAQMMRVSDSTLYRMRSDSNGPPWFQCGGRVLYPVAGVRDWIASRIAADMAGVR